MEIREEIAEILKYLKRNGVSRREVAEKLAYKEASITETLSRGGNEELLIRLRLLKEVTLLKSISPSNTAENGPTISKAKEMLAHAIQYLEMIENREISSSESGSVSKSSQEINTDNRKDVEVDRLSGKKIPPGRVQKKDVQKGKVVGKRS